MRSVKYALKKSLGTKCLTKCELETTLVEVEACINSKLTYVNEEPDVSDPFILKFSDWSSCRISASCF